MKFTWPLSLILVALLGYYGGSTFGMFGSNMCYSNVIDKLSKISLFVNASTDPYIKNEYRVFVDNLPTYGYETTCSDVQKQVDLFISEHKLNIK